MLPFFSFSRYPLLPMLPLVISMYLVQAKRAISRKEVLHADFLTPPVLKESLLLLGKVADAEAIAQGGYPQVKITNSLFILYGCKCI